MIDWKSKLTSRKFWACVADFVGMLLIALHVAEDTVTRVTALIIAGAGVVAYILGEGWIDAANAKADAEVLALMGEADEPEPAPAAKPDDP